MCRIVDPNLQRRNTIAKRVNMHTLYMLSTIGNKVCSQVFESNNIFALYN